MRIKVVNGVEIPFTPEEEAARDAEEAEWANRYIPTNSELDQEALNRALVEEGSLWRATTEMQLEEANRVRAALRGLGVTGMPNISRDQFIQALRAKMRSA